MSSATEAARALFRVTPSGVLLAASVRGSGVSVLQLIPLIALLRGALLVLDGVRALANPRPAAPSTLLKILRPSLQRAGGEWAAAARHAALGCVIVLRGASAVMVSASLLSASDKPYLAGLLMPLLLCLTLTARNTGRSGMTASTLVLAGALLVAGIWDANTRETGGAALSSVADWRGAQVLLLVFLAVSALAEVDYAMDGVCHCGDNSQLPRAVTIWLGTLSVVLFSALGSSMYSSWFVDGDPAGPSTGMRVLLSCILSLWASQAGTSSPLPVPSHAALTSWPAGMDAAALASERGKVWCDERMRGASLNVSAR